jgi:hypothetical protein
MRGNNRGKKSVMMKIPCGVAPRVAQTVKDAMEKAAAMIGNFESHRFSSEMEQAFFDLDEGGPEQLLYVCLSVISHIWTRSLNSRIEIRIRDPQAEFQPEFILVFIKLKNGEMAVQNRVAVKITESAVEENALESRNGEAAGRVFRLCYSNRRIAESPFGVAHDIVKTLVNRDWQAYESIPHNTLQYFFPDGSPRT